MDLVTVTGLPCADRVSWICCVYEVNLPVLVREPNLMSLIMAESRENVSNAVAGDIISLLIIGTYQVGDTLTGQTFEFEPLPTFTPEIFMKVSLRTS